MFKIKLKKMLNLFLVALMMVSSLFAFAPTPVLAGPDPDAKNQYKKISDLALIPIDMVKAGDNIFYSTSMGEENLQLWVTDGTEEGTLLLKDFDPADDEYLESDLCAIGDNIYFVVYTIETGAELWVSDGTESGTHVLKNIYSGNYNDAYNDLYVMNGVIYFQVVTEDNGVELWKTDGTENGTYMVTSLPSPDSGNINFINVLDDYLYYEYSYNEYNEDEEEYDNIIQLWKTNGTKDGTTLVKDNFGDIDNDNSVVYNDELYFSYGTREYGKELWKTDGTEEGTVLLKDIYEANNMYEDGSSNPSNFIVFNNKLYFSVEIHTYDQEHDKWGLISQLYMTDGTEEGTVIDEDLNELGVYSFEGAVIFNGSIYFQNDTYDEDDNDLGYELWVSDGSIEGTHLLKDIVTGEYDSEPSYLTVFSNKLYFMTVSAAAAEGEFYHELWESDGTEEGTLMLKTHLGFGYGNHPIYNFGDGIYYELANDYWEDEEDVKLWELDLELWKLYIGSSPSSYNVTFKDYDGTILKTETVQEGNSATAPANPSRTGYTFTVWDTRIDDITSDLTVTAIYSINTYNVTFKDYDGTVLKNQTVNYGTNAIAPSNPTRTGYIFKGWNNSYSNVTGNVVTTALYSAVESNNNNNNSNNTIEKETVEPEITIDDVTINISTSDLNQIKHNIKVLNDNNELINMYDINLILAGAKVQPDGYIDIRIPMTAEQKEYENLKVIYINDNNEITILPHTIEGNYIVFSVNHLSNYAVIGTKIFKATKTDTTLNNNDNQNGGIFATIADHPFIFTAITVGILFIIFIIARRKKDN